MRKYGESKTTRIIMATVPHVTSGLGLRKSQAEGFLLTQVYINRSAMCHIPEYMIFIVSAARTSHLSKQYTHLCKKKCNINIGVNSDKCFYDTVTFPYCLIPCTHITHAYCVFYEYKI